MKNRTQKNILWFEKINDKGVGLEKWNLDKFK